MMKFLLNNCVRKIKAQVSDIKCFDYNRELNLIAALTFGPTAYIWNPDTGKLVNQFNTLGHPTDIIFLPNRLIAVCAYIHGVAIYCIDTGERVLDVVTDFARGFCGTAALTHNDKLLTDNGMEFTIDFQKREILSSREIFHSDNRSSVSYLCCSKKNYTFCYSEFNEPGIHCVEVCNDGTNDSSTVEENVITKKTTLTCYKIECGITNINPYFIAHDGENIIFVSKDDKTVVLLEKASEESLGHIIVVADGFWNVGLCQIKIYDDGQLLLSDGSDVIRVYEYKIPNTLQGLCRHHINKIVKHNARNVDKLPIPKQMKNYLLYRAELCD